MFDVVYGQARYVVKDMAGDDLVTANHSLHEGKRYFSQKIADIAQYYIQ